ncbi:MAG: hypothetical protein K1X94_22050 [Sandaracinaceae bacterium]|nr:hypothetical protein [Sandaracinaceae bacterium]
MTSRRSPSSTRVALVGAVAALVGLLPGCPDTTPQTTDAGTDAVMGIVRCSSLDDPDRDGISNEDEGMGDADGDGATNNNDTDSDGDTILDAVEAGDMDCTTPPIDTDRDTTPDFLDLDSNGDGISDRDQATMDLDGDGIPDAIDPDEDGDGVVNTVEVGPEAGMPVDTDHDGIPDVRDEDSDNDTILDRHEGAQDQDRDGIPSFQDTDSDGDGILDAVEAGDGDPSTPPRACPNEVDPTTCNESGTECEVSLDEFADFADFDSDNDGLGDAEEAALGTDPCNVDSDGDLQSDLAEGAYEQYNCPDGMGSGGVDCGCATSASCTIPARHFYVVLPYGDPPIQRNLDFGTTIRVADIFFITDTTGSMGGTVMNVKRTVAGAGGIIERVADTIPDAWVGGGQHDDMPFGGYGSSPDEPFILAIGMTPPERSADVQTAFNGIVTHGGGDGPESQTQSLWQIITGEGNTWMGDGGWGGGATTYTIPAYRDRCLDTGWGAPCFRDGALPIIIHFSDICSHNGPPDEDPSCDPYTGITPAPATWTDTIAEMNRRGARYIGVNASGGASCSTVTGPSGFSPCWFMKRTATETGTVDLDGNPLVYDLPNTASTTEFADGIVEAIETVATRVALDVDTALRDDPSDTEGVLADHFIKRRTPSCNAETSGMPPTTDCWEEPVGVTHDQAIATFDLSTFYGVVPGTRVTFRITFQNDFYQNPDYRTKLFVAFIDVRGGGTTVLDTRQVFVVVPAGSGSIFG